MDLRIFHPRRIVRSASHLVGKKQNKPRPFSEFLAFDETLRAAKASGVSVGDFLERRHVEGELTPGDQTMEGLGSLGVFERPIAAVCEIGPGSGRYLERAIARCKPLTYEIYETSVEWRQWLVEKYGVIPRTCNGRTLAETEPGSIGLIHAHKVFSGLPHLVTMSYLGEMARAVKGGGWAVFDLMTEQCFTDECLEKWFSADPWNWEWAPHFVGREYAIEFLSRRGLELIGSFFVPSYPGLTECFAFRKPDE